MIEEKARSWKMEWMRLQGHLMRQRKVKKMSQDEAAERLAVSRRTFQRWETGDAIPSAMELFQWASLLGISIVSDVRPASAMPDASASDIVRHGVLS